MAEVFPVASGFPEYSGITIPEVWAGEILVKFYASTILSEISNTTYEGSIKGQGDTVHIRTTPNITINDHRMGQKLQYETPTPSIVDLLIDKGKSWSFISDDIVKGQSDYNYVSDWTTAAAKDLAVSIETAIFADIYASAHADNKGTAAGAIEGNINLGATGLPIALDKTNILDYIVDMGQVLTEQNVPDDDNRFLILPAWACGLVSKSDLKDSSLSGDDKSLLRKGSGYTGDIAGFKLFKSNLLARTITTNNPTNIIFGHKTALTFAAQLTKTEGPMRDKDFFGDFYRGLKVYGYEVIKPEALGHFYAYKG